MNDVESVPDVLFGWDDNNWNEDEEGESAQVLLRGKRRHFCAQNLNEKKISRLIVIFWTEYFSSGVSQEERTVKELLTVFNKSLKCKVGTQQFFSFAALYIIEFQKQEYIREMLRSRCLKGVPHDGYSNYSVINDFMAWNHGHVIAAVLSRAQRPW